MGLLGGIGGGLVSVIGGIAAANQAKQGNQANLNAANAGLGYFNELNPPSIEDQKLILQLLSQQGEYSPEMLSALNLGPSAMESVNADEQLVGKQMDALNQYEDISKGGLTEGDQAASRELNRKVMASDTARRKQILNEMAQRGVLGSGAELAAQLTGTQDQSENMVAANDKLIQQALERKMGALNNLASMSTQMRTQDVGEKSNKAKARDAINQFNVQNKQQVNSYNVGNANTAQQANLKEKQRVADTNVSSNNAAQQYNKQLLQKQYDNQMNLARAKAGQQQVIGQAAQAKGNANARSIAGISSGVANVVGSFGAPSIEEEEK